MTQLSATQPLPLPPLTLYSRAGCHLCELAEDALQKLEFRYTKVEITGQAELEALYGHDVPVLVTAHRVLLKGVFSRSRLAQLKLRLLQEAAGERRSSFSQAAAD